METKKLNKKYIEAKEAAAKNRQPRQISDIKKDRIPPGQKIVDKMVAMPAITLIYPRISKNKWRLRVYGEVEHETTWNWEDFNKLKQKDFMVDFHCVTHWSKLGQKFTGVPIEEIIKIVKPLKQVKFVIFVCYDGYTTNVPYQEIINNVAFVAIKMDGADIEPKFGGPARAVIPHLYGWKSAKFVKAIRFQSSDEPGFWETRGYNNHGDPWKEERYN